MSFLSQEMITDINNNFEIFTVFVSIYAVYLSFRSMNERKKVEKELSNKFIKLLDDDSFDKMKILRNSIVHDNEIDEKLLKLYYEYINNIYKELDEKEKKSISNAINQNNLSGKYGFIAKFLKESEEIINKKQTTI